MRGKYNSYHGSVASTYDAAGDRTQLTWQDGQSVGYSYDLLGRMSTITDGVGQVAQYTYDSFGRLQHTTFAGNQNTLAQGFLYGGDSRPSITGYGFADSSKNLQSWVTYNAAGGIKVRAFTNDLYDWSSTAAVQQGYGINGLNQVATAGSTSLAYDLRGGLSSDGVHTYSYDAPHDQLDNVQGGGATVGLFYDALHRLAQTQGSATTQFVYDGSAISEELSTSGAVLARYVPGPDGTPLLWYNGSGTGDRRWLLKDQQGSVIAVANSSGQSLATNTYDAYGLPGSSNTGRFQYAGYAFVPEIGLYNTGARTYSPTLGRFLQTDPIGYGDGMNWYAYSHGDPVNGKDPTGLDGDDDGDGGPDAPPPPIEGGALDFGDIFASSVYIPCPGGQCPQITFNVNPIPELGPLSTPGVIQSSNQGTGGGGGGGRSGRVPQGMPGKSSNSCSNPSNLARGLDAFSTYTQRAAGTVALASLVPQAFGGPIDPVADVFTGAGEALAGVLEVSALSASAVSAGIQLFQGNGVPAATTAASVALSAASGVTYPAGVIANTINGEITSAASGSPCK